MKSSNNKVVMDIYNIMKNKFPDTYPSKQIIKEIIDEYERMIMELFINNNDDN